MYLWCDWLSKHKYFLVAGVEEIPLLLYISTNKPAFCRQNPAIDSDFLRVAQNEYPFLDYDSWLDCGDVCVRFEWRSIQYQLKNREGKICGKISLATRDLVMVSLGQSERLATKYQMLISDALQMVK